MGGQEKGVLIGGETLTGQDQARPHPVRFAIQVWLPWPLMLSLGAVVLAWQIAAMSVGSNEILPYPHLVLAACAKMIDGDLPSAIGETVLHLSQGFAAGASLGFLLALAAASFRPVYVVVDPLIELLRQISGLAWYPLAAIMLGVTDLIALLLVFYVSIFPVFVNTLAGIRGVERRLLDAAAVLGASRYRIIVRVVLPAALPMILAGLRLSLGVSWMTLIAAEVLGADYLGMGELIFAYERDFRQTNVVATILSIGLIGLAMDWIVRLIQWRLTRWRATVLEV